MGTMPMIMASAVISTGRKRVNPASSAASTRRAPLANLVLREAHDQNAVGGRDAHTHYRAGQRRHADRRVRQEQNPDDTGQRRGKRRNDDEGVEPRLEVHDDQQVDEHDRDRQAGQQAEERRPHGLNRVRERPSAIPAAAPFVRRRESV